jgi:uncharacterized RDD family membrane protein YckC
MPFCSSCGTQVTGEHKFCATCGGALGTAPVPAAQSDLPVKYAGFWRRFAALSIEISVYNVIYGVIVYSTNIDFISLGLSSTYWTISLLVGFFYITVMTYKYGGTLGKLFVGLQVRRVEPSIELSYPRCVARYFSFFLSMILLGIGLLIQPFTKKKQALHDMIVDTEVIDHKKRPAIHIWLINIVHVLTSIFIQAVTVAQLV